MPFFKQKSTAFGLDLSDISVKLMQLEKHSDHYKILGYSDHGMPKGIMVNDVVMNEDALAEEVHKVMKKMEFGNVNTDQIVASVPESKAFVRVIQIPKMDEKAAEAAIPIEAEQYIPIPLDQTYLDWEIVGTHDDKMDILVTAAPKEYIDNYMRVLKKTGLKPVSLQVESAAVARSLISPDKKDKDILILDMNTYRTSLIIVKDGNLQFTSSVPIAGDAFTQSIARALGVPPDQAEKIKREVGLDDTKEHQNVKSALKPVVDNLITEVKNILKFHTEHSPTQISQIMLCGGTAKLLHLSSYMYEQLADYDQIDIVLGNPWVNVFAPKQSSSIPMSREDSLSYTTVLGLAIHGANLELK